MGEHADRIIDDGLREASTRLRMPRQKPGLSKQDYATPPDLIAAIKKRFGVKEFAYDLAASQENTKAKFFFCEEQDSLKQDWLKLRGDLWLNPPFSRIGPWAEKCFSTTWRNTEPHLSHVGPIMRRDRRIFFLVPAAVGANWWRESVDGKARVFFLNGRPSFDGVGPYSKDIALCLYADKPGYECWRWK